MKTEINSLSNLFQKTQPQKGLSLADQKRRLSENVEYIPDPYKKVASSMEQQFANFMLKEMNKTTGSQSKGDTSSDYYKSLLTGERAKAMSEKGDGLGLKKIILDQIYPHKLRNKMAYENFNTRERAQFSKNNIKMHRLEEKHNQLNQLSSSIPSEKGNDNE